MTDTPNPESQSAPEVESQKLAVNVDEVGALTRLPADADSENSFNQLGEKLSSFLDWLQTVVPDFFDKYGRSLTLIAILLAGGVSLKILFAVLGAINELPLLEPTFELIGIGYTVWFVFRYLLKGSDRQELGQEVRALWDQVSGGRSSEN